MTLRVPPSVLIRMAEGRLAGRSLRSLSVKYRVPEEVISRWMRKIAPSTAGVRGQDHRVEEAA